MRQAPEVARRSPEGGERGLFAELAGLHHQRLPGKKARFPIFAMYRPSPNAMTEAALAATAPATRTKPSPS